MEDFQQQGNEEEYRIDGGRRRRRDAIEWIANGYGKTTVKNLRFCVFNYLHFSLFSFFWGVLRFSEFWRGRRGVVVDYWHHGDAKFGKGWHGSDCVRGA